MEVLLEITKILVPSLLVFLTAWLMIRSFLNKEADVVKGLIIRDTENRRIDVLKKTTETLLPIRLQAYERMTLFCSRIEIGQLLKNAAAVSNMSSEMYKMTLVQQVEEEFNHNITQQVYMTDDLWNIILLAKKEVTQIFEKMHSDVVTAHSEKGLTGQPDAKAFLNALGIYLESTPQIGYVQALTAIKKEVGILFN